MYGLIDMKGENSKGDKVTLKQYPVQVKYAGGNAVVMSNLDSLLSNKGILWSNKVELSTEEKTVGGNTFYNIKIGKITSLDIPANLLEDSDDGRAYQLFKNDIEAKNEQVMGKYHAHLKKYADDTASVSKVTNVDIDILDKNKTLFGTGGKIACASQRRTYRTVWEDRKKAIRKQFKEKRDTSFRVRMSGIGKPLCQLQMEKSGAKKEDMPYNSKVKISIW